MVEIQCQPDYAKLINIRERNFVPVLLLPVMTNVPLL